MTKDDSIENFLSQFLCLQGLKRKAPHKPDPNSFKTAAKSIFGHPTQPIDPFFSRLPTGA